MKGGAAKSSYWHDAWAGFRKEDSEDTYNLLHLGGLPVSSGKSVSSLGFVRVELIVIM